MKHAESFKIIIQEKTKIGIKAFPTTKMSEVKLHSIQSKRERRTNRKLNLTKNTQITFLQYKADHKKDKKLVVCETEPRAYTNVYKSYNKVY